MRRTCPIAKIISGTKVLHSLRLSNLWLIQTLTAELVLGLFNHEFFMGDHVSMVLSRCFSHVLSTSVHGSSRGKLLRRLSEGALICSFHPLVDLTDYCHNGAVGTRCKNVFCSAISIGIIRLLLSLF